MSFIKSPMKGMNDFLPESVELRELVLEQIKRTYKSFGFSQIDTPCVEHIENLAGGYGGENEKLIFRILKRGDRLKSCDPTNFSSLVDAGLRYDLTVPLSRYFSNNFQNLPLPFKSFQIGNVWRAEKPQNGRFRQFLQCDIDILGDETVFAEIDLLVAVTTLLKNLGFKNFQIKINDRRILHAMLQSVGVNEQKFDNICIILDKIDKIGVKAVENELIKYLNDEKKVLDLMSFFKNFDKTSCEKFCAEKLRNFLEDSVMKNVDKIINFIKNIGNDLDFSIVFDPTLVRGLGYYTGTIFEIVTPEANFSIAGGGRYDNMIGTFLDTKTVIPACGISIGFERIIQILRSSTDFFAKTEKIAFLIDKNIDDSEFFDICNQAEQLRKTGKNVMIAVRKKNIAWQKKMLAELGYTKFF